MDDADKLRLQKSAAILSEDLRAEDVMDYLLQEGVLSVDDTERIRCEKTRRDKVQKLLSILPYRGSKAYSVLRTALLKDDAYTWLVEELDKTDVSSTVERSASRVSPLKELNHRVFKRISEHLDVVKDWRSFGRAMGLDESALQEIEYANNMAGPKEMAYQVLIKLQRSSSSLDAQSFLKKLRDNGYTYLADELDGK